MQIEFLNQLSAEITLAKTMAKILSDERNALANSDAAQMDKTSQEKRSLLADLEAHARKRLQLVTNMGYQKKLGTVRHFLSQKDPSQALLQSWDSLNRQLQLCSDQNQINGRIISLSQRKTEMTLNVLRGQLPQSNSAYNHFGKMTHHSHGVCLSSA
ncbi:MAG: flagellar protein FlgN [Gammaproteobacteria bacterium]|nr:flagellar protein FlgN [Gammaproteobacteria bacterium]